MARTKAMIPAAVSVDRSALVPTNPRVKSIAFRMRWNVDTVIRRVEAALPSPIEQQLYLSVANGFRIQPESLRKMLDVFLDGDELRASDMRQTSTGQNLFVSRFEQIVEKVQAALSLVDKAGDAMTEARFSMRDVARLVDVYGEDAEEVIGSIIENVDEVSDRLGLQKYSSTAVVGVAVTRLCEKLDQRGIVPLTIEEMFP